MSDDELSGENEDSVAAGETNLTDIAIPEYLPVLPARDMVAFPSVMISFYVGRPVSLNAIDLAQAGDRLVLVVAQKDQQNEDPSAKELYRVGVVANIVRTLKLSDERQKVLIQGLVRAKVVAWRKKDDYLEAKIEPLIDLGEAKVSAEAKLIMNRIRTNIQAMIEYQDISDDLLMVIEEVDDPGMMADLIFAHSRFEVGVAQAALEEFNPIKRLKLADKLINEDMNKIRVSEQIRGKTEDSMTKGQREYYLREQMKLIREELGEVDDVGRDLSELRRAIEEAGMPKQAYDESRKQLKRLELMSPEAAESSLVRTYLEWMTDLPWSKNTKDRLDLKIAKKVLEEDHFGLLRVKDRILEYLSVRKLNQNSRGPILCLVGPPGVGKTSLGRSIARSLKRNFVRISLGGMRDEAEIRGHRRTYVGALPGRIIQGMKQAGSNNPVFLLDELDKIGADFRGDPAAALLEVLDPEQNKDFSDHYINVTFDLSKVMFIATANTTDTIPSALLDRLEIISIAGYTAEEKLNIAKRYLVPRQLSENGIAKVGVKFDDESLFTLIDSYTREAGVRHLEREIGSLCRKLARQVAEGKKVIKRLNSIDVKKFLGPIRYDPELNDREHAVGVVTGLAWTVYGGEPMLIEASIAKGNGKLMLTGSLGNVMQESAQAALFYTRSNASQFGVDPDFHQKYDMHVHFPAGATPKDGPSAGITIAVALVSSLLNRKIRKDIAMTGEITLRGNVLPVGGIKEKALAALRYGVKQVIIPADNVKDLEEIPEEQRRKLRFIPVKHMSEVLPLALVDLNPRTSKRSGKKPSLNINTTV